MNRLRSCLAASILLTSLVAGCIYAPRSNGEDSSTTTGTACVDGSAPKVAVPDTAQTGTRAWTADASNAARASIAQAYAKDPTEYWAVHGLPALARGAALRKGDGVADPNVAFADVMKGFEPDRFLTACELGKVHSMICARTKAVDLPTAIGDWMLEGGDLTTRGLRELLTTSFNASVLVALTPESAKTTTTLPVVQDVACTNVSVGANDDADAGVGLTWSRVSGGTRALSGTRPDGMCVTKAVGICTQRLGMRTPTVTPEAWQGLSDALGAVPTGGVPIDGVKSYFDANGYSLTDAWDGPRESAALEAQRALARGCDVFIWYYSGEAESHMEVVNGIDTRDRPDGEAVITTNSWGQAATTTFTSGTYSNKSDVNLYPATFRPTAKATLYYACAK